MTVCEKCGKPFDDEDKRVQAAKVRRHRQRAHGRKELMDSLPILSSVATPNTQVLGLSEVSALAILRKNQADTYSSG